MIKTLTLIGFGEAGGILGQDLAAAGIEVFTYDRLHDDPKKRPALLDKGRRCGVTVCDSAARALSRGEWVISAVTADRALKVAQDSAPLMLKGQLFIDINSVAPATKRLAEAIMAQHGINYVDAAVMAPVPPQRLRTPILLGGTRSEEVCSQLNALGMNTRVVANTIGVASAIKMCRSIMIKGLEALTTECLSAARQYDAEDEVLTSLHKSFPSMGWNSDLPHYLISRVAEHGLRRSEEMKEVAKTVSDVGVVAYMSRAIVSSQRGLIDSMAEADIEYSSLEPFSWSVLVDTLYGSSAAKQSEALEKG